MLRVKIYFNLLLDAAKFKKSFVDAKDFNKAAKAGEELVYADVIKEDEDEEPKKKTEEKTEEKKEEKKEEKTEEKDE